MSEVPSASAAPGATPHTVSDLGAQTGMITEGTRLFKTVVLESAALATGAALIPACMSISARLRAEQLSVFFDSRISSNAAIAGLTSAGWVWDRHLQSSSVLLFYYMFCRGSSPKWVLDSGFFASVQWLITRLISLWLFRTFRIFTDRQGARSLALWIGCVLRLDSRILPQLVSVNGLSRSGCRWFCCRRTVCCCLTCSNGGMDQLCQSRTGLSAL